MSEVDAMRDPDAACDGIAQLSSPLLAGMTPLELAAVESFLERRLLPAGEILFRQGEMGSELYLVKSGSMGSYVTQADGSRRELYSFGPGDQFGEMAVIEREPRSATCYAKEDTELRVLAAIDFYRLVWEHPMIGIKLMRPLIGVMSRWFGEASGFLGDMVRWGDAARRRSITDDLSGLFNRRFLDESIRLRFSRSSPEARRSSLVMLDIDHFRDINARFGPAAGDAVIANAGPAFAAVVDEAGLAARLSGDEFAFFLPGLGLEAAAAIAEKIRAAAEELYLEFKPSPASAPERISITVSVGVAEGGASGGARGGASGESRGDAPESLMEAADRALYRAKEGGRNRVSLG